MEQLNAAAAAEEVLYNKYGKAWDQLQDLLA
jgi:hypothetical protein